MAAWIEREATRTNRHLFGVNAMILGLLLMLACLDARYYWNFVLGCQKIEAVELGVLTSPTQRWRNFVTVRGSKSASTGYQDIVKHIEKSSGRIVSTDVQDEYVLLEVADKILVVKAAPGPQKLEYSGELVATEESVQHDLIEPLVASDTEMRAMILPFTLNVADYREQGYWAFGIAIPLLLLAGWNCLKALRRQGEIQTAPIWRQMSIYGDAQQLSAAI